MGDVQISEATRNEWITLLIDMGFDPEWAAKHLKHAGYDIEMALETLSQHDFEVPNEEVKGSEEAKQFVEGGSSEIFESISEQDLTENDVLHFVVHIVKALNQLTHRCVVCLDPMEASYSTISSCDRPFCKTNFELLQTKSHWMETMTSRRDTIHFVNDLVIEYAFRSFQEIIPPPICKHYQVIRDKRWIQIIGFKKAKGPQGLISLISTLRTLTLKTQLLDFSDVDFIDEAYLKTWVTESLKLEGEYEELFAGYFKHFFTNNTYSLEKLPQEENTCPMYNFDQYLVINNSKEKERLFQ